MDNTDKIKIDIAGRGNVAEHLRQAFCLNEERADTAIVDPHTLDSLRTDADFIIICVSDNAIGDVAARIPADTGAVVAHTSGTTGIEVFGKPGYRYGVLYPLQTFTKGIPLRYDEIPVFVEGCDSETEKRLAGLGRMFSTNVNHADSKNRRALHVASVFACNFTNHLWTISEDVLQAEGMRFEDLRPLMTETLRKAFGTGPAKGQTGPAVRHDSVTIDRHLEMLSDRPGLADIYRTLTESIQNYERNKLQP